MSNSSEITNIEDTVMAERNSYDDDFIYHFLADPKAGKTQAIIKAGYTGKNPNQMAYRVFERLRPRINEEFEKRKNDYAMLGHRIIVEVAKDTETSKGDKLKAGKMLMDYGGHSPSHVMDVNFKIDGLTDDQLDNRISELERMIAAGSGKVINADQVIEQEEEAVFEEFVPKQYSRPGDNEDTEVEDYDLSNEEDLEAICGEYEEDNGED